LRSINPQVAHGGEILEAKVPPDFESLFVVTRVIGGDAGIKLRCDLRGGAGLRRRRHCEAGAKDSGKKRQNLVLLGHVRPKATLAIVQAKAKLLGRRA